MGSVRRRGQQVRIKLDADETGFLTALAQELIARLSDGSSPEAADPQDPLAALTGAFAEPVEPPADPILARILPDAYRDDAGAAAEFRRLTDSGLRTAKSRRLSHLVDMLASGERSAGSALRLDLDDAEVEEWLYTLTDIRLMFGTWIEATEDLDEQRRALEPGSKRYAEIEAYDWLASLQESLVHVLTGY
ncbi:MAG TPA: DUF2017 domain-containing protein [Mycobacteriales bacterium]|nr:DUF2017 domain-containing protein [Mycobacteriales bacterium]